MIKPILVSLLLCTTILANIDYFAQVLYLEENCAGEPIMAGLLKINECLQDGTYFQKNDTHIIQSTYANKDCTGGILRNGIIIYQIRFNRVH